MQRRRYHFETHLAIAQLVLAGVQLGQGLSEIELKDAGEKLGLSAETLEAGADEFEEFANKNTTRILVAKPVRKEVDSDD